MKILLGSLHVNLNICVSKSFNYVVRYNHYILNFNLIKYYKGIMSLYQIDNT